MKEISELVNDCILYMLATSLFEKEQCRTIKINLNISINLVLHKERCKVTGKKKSKYVKKKKRKRKRKKEQVNIQQEMFRKKELGQKKF